MRPVDADGFTLPVTGSSSPVMSEADAVLNSDIGLAFAEVTATTMDVFASPVVGSFSLVMSEADVVLNSDLGLAFAKVTATTMDVSTSPVAIPLILECASDSGLLADSVSEVLVAFAGSGEASGKANRKSFPAKGLLRWGFLGLGPVSSPPVLASPQQLGTSPFLMAGSGVSSRGVVEMGSRLSLSHFGMTDGVTPNYSSISKSRKVLSEGEK